MRKITVLGAGSWGTALAKHFADKGFKVDLWARRAPLVEAIEQQRVNTAYLPGIELPPSLRATADLDAALHATEGVLMVVPSHGLRALLRDIVPRLPAGIPLVSASKGIENETLMLMSEVIAEETRGQVEANRVCFLGGPSFAKEVAACAPTAVVVAGRDPRVIGCVQEMLGSDRLRAYTTDDVVGLELGGAIKNVIAIAAGASDGLGFGHNARAGLITRGLAELTRLATHMGAHPLTLAGLSGMGDLVLTCTGDLSRNRTVGLELGKGRKLADVVGEMHMVAEGVRTAKSVYHLAQRHEIDMPIVTQVYEVLYEDKSPSAAVDSLLQRTPRPERDT